MNKKTHVYNIRTVIFILLVVLIFGVMSFSVNGSVFYESFNDVEGFGYTNYMDNITLISAYSTVNESFTTTNGKYVIGYFGDETSGQNVINVSSDYWFESGSEVYIQSGFPLSERSALLYEFPNPISFSEYTNISIRGAYYDIGASLGTIDILFKDEHDNCLFDVYTGTSDAWYNPSSDNIDSCDVDLYCKLWGNYTYTLTDINNQIFSLNLTQCNVTYINDISYMYIMYGTANSGSNKVIIKDLYIYDYYNGTNSLPDVDVSLSNDVICVDEDISEVGFNITWNIRDNENDTIFYAYDFIYSQLEKKYIFYRKSIVSAFGYTAWTEDQEIKNYEYIRGDSCPIDYTLNVNFANQSDYLIVNNSNGEFVPMLGLLNGDSCGNGGDSFYFKSDNIYSDIEYSSSFYSISPTEGFNISVWNIATNHKLLSFGINRTSTGLQFANINSTGFEDWQNLFVSDRVRVLFETNRTGNTYQLYLANPDDISGTSQNITYNLLDNTVIPSVVEVEINGDGFDNLISQEFFSYGGFANNPEFSTTPITEITFNPVGQSILVFYISDTFNQPNNYVTVNVPFSIFSEDYCISDTDEELREVGETVSSGITSICSAFNGYYYNEFSFNFCNIVLALSITISVLVTIFIGVIARYITPHLSNEIMLVMFSIMMYIMDIYIYELSTNMIIFVSIVFVIGVIGTIIKIISGYSGGNNGE